MISLKEKKILETAERLFSEYSYLNVGIDRIINESEVAKMTFYKYFPSKDFLIARVLDHRKQFLINSLEKIFESNLCSLDKIHEVFDWFYNWFSTKKFNGCMFIKASLEFPCSEEFNKINLLYKDWFKTKLVKIFKDLNLSLEKSEELSDFLLLVLDGLTVKASIKSIDRQELNTIKKMFLKNIYI